MGDDDVFMGAKGRPEGCQGQCVKCPHAAGLAFPPTQCSVKESEYG